MDLRDSLSDHRRITFQLSSIVVNYKYFRNPRLADWEAFTYYLLDNMPSFSSYNYNEVNATDVELFNNQLCDTLFDAFTNACPVLTVKQKASSKAWWTPALSTMRSKVNKALCRANSNLHRPTYSQLGAALSLL